MKLFLLFALSLFVAGEAMAQNSSKEDEVQTCQAILGDLPAAADCAKAFKPLADCCIQYDEVRLAKACAKMSTIDAALTCFSEIHEVGFWKAELNDENEPGLAEKFSMQWKKNVMRECIKEPTKKAALDCAVLQKSGTRWVYKEANEKIAREAKTNDPIFKFCRQAFGDYWEGVEDCVKKQTAAKRRLGLE